MKYTEQIHAEGLLEIFSQNLPCLRCPSAVMRKRYGMSWFDKWDGESLRMNGGDPYGLKHTDSPMNAPQCDVCWDFIGGQRWDVCPCYNGNQQRAAKLTWLALESKGYLE